MNAHLDHAGLIAADLELAGRQLALLGFNVLPPSLHTLPNQDGSLRSAGTANQCVMLERGYLEVVSVTDPTANSFSNTEIGGFLTRFEGLHLLAMGTDSAQAVEARLSGLGTQPVELRSLNRSISTIDGPRNASFRLVVVPQLSGPDVTFFFIEHRTPELLWTPRSIIHPNGALALLELVVVTEDLPAAGRLYEAVFGQAGMPRAGGLSFELMQSRFLVMTLEAAERYYGAPLPDRTLPHCAGQAIEVADIAVTAALLTANGVPFDSRGERLTLAPANACGSFMQFVQVAP